MSKFFPDLESFTHPENGMTAQDMMAILNVARRRNEIIMFRSTGPWSRRWIERGHPTKPFHVKGKSSDWGPHAGFVPHLGIYSKVGGNAQDARDGDDANAHGIEEGFAMRAPLTLSEEDFKMQLSQSEESPARQAIQRSEVASVPESLNPDPRDRFVWADRGSGTETKRFAFWARWNDPTFGSSEAHQKRYTFYVFPDFIDKKGEVFCPGTTCQSATDLGKHIGRVQLFEVMCTAEKDSDKKTTPLPLTGDYDLFAIGPHFNDYSPSDRDKRMDFFLDNWQWKKRKAFYERRAEILRTEKGDIPASDRLLSLLKQWAEEQKGAKEDPHKGNVTLRLLEVLDALNLEMGIYREKFPLKSSIFTLKTALKAITESAKVPPLPPRAEREKILKRHHLFRRAHHNEEAGRPFFAKNEPTATFGDDKLNGACPITVFQPSPIPGYPFSIGTLVNAAEIRTYFLAAYEAGYVLPKNPNWAMASNIQRRIDQLNAKG